MKNASAGGLQPCGSGPPRNYLHRYVFPKMEGGNFFADGRPLTWLPIKPHNGHLFLTIPYLILLPNSLIYAAN
jgi:hypothetical protein